MKRSVQGALGGLRLGRTAERACVRPGLAGSIGLSTASAGGSLIEGDRAQALWMGVQRGVERLLTGRGELGHAAEENVGRRKASLFRFRSIPTFLPV